MTSSSGALAPGSTYARVAQLPLTIERCELVPLVRDTSSGFTKVSIVVRLSGGGQTGEPHHQTLAGPPQGFTHQP